jgi:hypothetical protein
MKPALRPALLSLAVLCLIAAPLRAAGPETPLFDSNERVSVSTEPTLNEGQADLDITCQVRGAELYIDRNYEAIVPDIGSLTLSIQPGSHYLEIQGPGYYALGIWLNLEEKTRYYLGFSPRRITGVLALSLDPPDASVLLDGTPLEGRTIEVPTGSHSLSARRFGYTDRSLDIEIVEGRTTNVSLVLEKAAFEINRPAFTRKVFNPRNAGAPGWTALEFQATSYGSAKVEIHAPDGSLVATLDFPDIRGWSQSQSWKGLGPDGRALPDGLYTASLTASPAPGVAGEPVIERSAEVRIDSSLVITSFGTASVLPGLLHVADPLPRPAGTLAAEAFWFAPWAEPQSSAFGLSAAYSLGGIVTLSMHAAAETGAGPFGGGDLAASALVSLFGDGTSTAAGGLLVKGGFSSSSSPALPGAGTGLEATLPLALRLGGFSLALSPGALVDLGASPARYLGLARAGLSFEARSFRLGFSGELPLSFSGGLPAPLWPARAALEARLMAGSTPFVAALYLGSELEPGSAPRPSLGVGLGLLF